jgi:hypothetical protein
MGFFDRFRKKKETTTTTTTEQSKTGQGSTEKKIKAYTSDGKPIYE